MAIASYSELKTAVESWLDHSLFTARVPEFIALFEATANRRLRARQQEATANLTFTNGSTTLPSDYLMWRAMVWNGSVQTTLEYVTQDYMTAAFPSRPDGTPRMFSVQGSTLRIMPTGDGSGGALFYFQKIPALSDGAPTNWLISAHPDLYLFGALVEAEMFGVNDDRAPLWKARRDEIFDEIERLSNKTRGAGAVRVMGQTP